MHLSRSDVCETGNERERTIFATICCFAQTENQNKLKQSILHSSPHFVPEQMLAFVDYGCGNKMK